MPRSPKVLVTGGKGMLGSAFAEQARAFGNLQVRALGHDELDVCDRAALAAHSDWVSDGWIIHCAARVDVEGCARDPEAARQVIVEGTRNVAELAARSSARLLYPQSFLTYDGAQNPISEDETPRPLSLYGELKYEAEKLVNAMIEAPLIICMAGFFGGYALDKNFVGRIIPVMYAAMMRGERHFDVGQRVWQPTWTDDLAFNALHLLGRGAHGRYQMACIGEATFAEIAHEITLALGWQDRFTIVPVEAAAVAKAELGRRPDVAVLSCTRLNDEHMNLQRPWRPTLHAYLQGSFFNQYRLETQ